MTNTLLVCELPLLEVPERTRAENDNWKTSQQAEKRSTEKSFSQAFSKLLLNGTTANGILETRLICKRGFGYIKVCQLPPYQKKKATKTVSKKINLVGAIEKKNTIASLLL